MNDVDEGAAPGFKAVFETPENVRIEYATAGAGGRFLAWLLDQLIVTSGSLLIVALLTAAALASGVLEQGFASEGGDKRAAVLQLGKYLGGIGLLVWGFGSFLYYAACELFLGGQSIAKRLIGLRVVKANGFSLDPMSLLVRNLFRLVDHIPLLWVVPVLSARTQRCGDMAAGTLVVQDQHESLSRLRREMARSELLEPRFRFGTSALERLRSVDVRFVETCLDRWDELPPRQLAQLLSRTLPALSRRLQSPPPAVGERLEFLENLLSAEYRRRGRSIA